jgi:hypothetical protein
MPKLFVSITAARYSRLVRSRVSLLGVAFTAGSLPPHSGISPEAGGSGDPSFLINFFSRSSPQGYDHFMSSFLVLEICLLLLSSDGERAGWNHFLHSDSVEDEGDNYDVSILTSITWRFLFPDGDIKMEMVSPP